MNSLQSLREIRAMDFFLYGGVAPEDYVKSRIPCVQKEGEVIATATYDLKTREITVEEGRVSPDGKLTE